MANTKKVLEEDFTKAKQAETAEDVNNQDARTRLWQSLNTTYTNQMEESDKAYDKAISQQNNAMLARGLGRSSYASQIAANMYGEKSNARNKLGEALIADYQNRIGQIEAQEKEDERWERQFAAQEQQNAWQREFQEAEAARQQGNWEKDYAANRADTAWSQGFQQSQLDYQKQRDTVADQQYNQQFAYQQQRDAVADQQWQTQYNEQVRQYNQNLAYQQQRDAVADQQWNQQYNEQLRQFNENMAYQRERANVSDAQWQKTYDENLRQFNAQMAQQEAQFKANFDFQVSEANRQQSNWEIQQAFAEKQWQAQQEQWKQEFDYNKMSTEQKLNYETVMYALQNGKDVSDDMLRKAGISRADFNSMKAAAASVGGGYSSSSSSSSDSSTPNDSDVNAALGSSSNPKYVADVAHSIASSFKAGASQAIADMKGKVGTTSTSAISSAAQKEIGAAKSAGEVEALMKKYGYIK